MAVVKPTGFSLLEAAQLAAGFDRLRLQDAKKALQLVEGEPFNLADAIKFAMAHKLRTTDFSTILYDDALDACLKEKNHISTAHYQRLAQRGRSFGEFIGPSRGCLKKTSHKLSLFCALFCRNREGGR
ncbi:MAG: hypothetical protein QM790_16765 [Nibricoccus sp.]